MGIYKVGEARSIELKYLKPDRENFRFEPADTDDDAIEVMIDDQQTSLANLAEDILKEGLSPAELVMVCLDETDGRYVVVDGNRRLISMLAVLDPTLVPASLDDLRDQFEKLHATNQIISGDEQIRCVVFPNKEAAKYWIRRQHAGKDEGRGKDEWDAVVKDRFKASVSTKPIALAAWEFTREGADEDIKRLMEKASYYTNFQRILESKVGKDGLGISGIGQDGKIIASDPETTRRMLREVVRDFGNRGIDVNTIRKSPDIKRYINGVKQRVTGKKQVAKRTSKRPRKTVIPSNCPMPVADAKINAIFDELRRLNCEKFPLAASFLLRALLELSLDKYESVEPKYSALLTDRGRKNQVAYRLGKLFEMLEKVIGKRPLSPYKKATLENKALPLTEELNAYVHNPILVPLPKDLMWTWDHIQGLFSILWDEIAKAGG